MVEDVAWAQYDNDGYCVADLTIEDYATYYGEKGRGRGYGKGKGMRYGSQDDLQEQFAFLKGKGEGQRSNASGKGFGGRINPKDKQGNIYCAKLIR